ncbi:hypothetical protein PPTG_24351 [Phytophthora nicotianae INRA-310]|uniref:Uncharacterized protein n=1 Tax=Phytophthora nicotianae (strain INRA-310) TaxID=761204 RepID=W2PGF4_PHYN3|nr:hypothetical protein PPTG_24351 [Phytophthora nicotianae INRA-310]ETM99956.1 hypothetical protein PPTG_24351 [Phytophthora nicotianae INRA-310]
MSITTRHELLLSLRRLRSRFFRSKLSMSFNNCFTFNRMARCRSRYRCWLIRHRSSRFAGVLELVDSFTKTVCVFVGARLVLGSRHLVVGVLVIFRSPDAPVTLGLDQLTRLQSKTGDLVSGGW